jgi:hypothetical protein
MLRDKAMSNYNEFLKSFFDIEIYFLSSATLQSKAWGNAKGDEQFGSCLLRSFESWATIMEHKENFKLSIFQFNQIQKLFDMLETFQMTNEFPTTPNEYLALLRHPEWKKIQEYAQNIYKTIGSNI